MTTQPTPRQPRIGTTSLTGLIDFFAHAPLNLCGPWLDTSGPYTGNVTLTHFTVAGGGAGASHVVGDSEGVIVDISGPIPPEWGRDDGWRSTDGLYSADVFIPPLGQLVVQHSFISGGYVTTQIVPIQLLPTLVMWDPSTPARVGLATAPGVSFDLLYVRTGYPPPP